MATRARWASHQRTNCHPNNMVINWRVYLKNENLQLFATDDATQPRQLAPAFQIAICILYMYIVLVSAISDETWLVNDIDWASPPRLHAGLGSEAISALYTC